MREGLAGSQGLWRKVQGLSIASAVRANRLSWGAAFLWQARGLRFFSCSRETDNLATLALSAREKIEGDIQKKGFLIIVKCYVPKNSNNPIVLSFILLSIMPASLRISM